MKPTIFLRSSIIAPLIACLLLSSTAPLSASDQFLDACLKIAEARDKHLVVAREQMKLAGIRITRTGRSFFPGLALQRKMERGKTIVDEYQAEEMGLRAAQPIYEGGRQTASYRYECLTEGAAKYNYTKLREELFYKIKLAYYEMLSLKMEYTVLKKAFEDVDKLQEKVKVEYAAKAISELDLVEAQNFRDKVENLFRAAEMNLDLADKRLLVLVNVNSIDSVPVLMPESLSEDVPEISFTLKECLGFVNTNNIDLKLNQTQIQMARQRIVMNRSKVIPKLYLEGFYGQSGEAFVTEPLRMSTVWMIEGKIYWSLWGNSLEAIRHDEKSVPNDILDTSARIDVQSNEVRLNLLDDLDYFVESKEGKIGSLQAEADYRDTFNKNVLDFEKVYNDYANSLMNARTLRNEITLHQRKLDLMHKRNDLYEIATVEVMGEAYKYAETLSSFSKTLYTNYASVAEMERMTMIPLR
jgi:outer membrane protein TolC